MSLPNDVAILEKVAALLNDRDQGFALNLVKYFKSYGKLSPKQSAWVLELAQRALAPATPRTIDVGKVKGVIDLLEGAAKHLKFPKLVLQAGEHLVRLSIAGPRAKAPGTINVVGCDGEKPWFGRITQHGEYEPARNADAAAITAITAALKALAANPAKVAADYGKLTGQCCFCRLPLTDARSTAVGYGPVCAEHFSLPWG
jgi:hypothetical protein